MTEKEIILEQEIEEKSINLEVDEEILIVPNLQSKDVIPSKEIQIITADKNYDGLEQVNVESIPNEYIIPNGTLEVSENGNVDVTNFKIARVGVYTSINLQDKTIEITKNGTTNIVADTGYDGLNNVEVTTNIASGDGEEPEKGYIVTNYDDDGYPTEIKIKGITTIPNYAIGSESSTSVNAFSKKVTKINIDDDVTNIGTHSFSYLSNLTQINLPDSITKIGTYAFASCGSLVLDKLPSSLTGAIGQNCFSNCKKITVKQIPDGVTQFTKNCFYNCTSLTQISMRNVTTFGPTGSPYIFHSCTGLKAVWIGSAITDNGLNANIFNNCTNLKKIFIDLPRATVEAFTNYSTKWSNDTVSTDCQVICNDDEGFMTKEEFDVIDWATYTG